MIVANLPYNVATLLLIGWLETEPWPPWYERMVLMFQKEVAERIVAAPGTQGLRPARRASRSGARAPRLLFTLKPEAFTPPPAVASAVVEFDPIERPSPECSVADAGDRHGRRLRPAPQDAAPEPASRCAPNPRRCCAAAGIDPTLRGEALTVRDFARLAYVLERLAGALSPF